MSEGNWSASSGTIGVILATMAALAAVEAVLPLRERARSGVRMRANLALTFITFATNIGWNALLIAALVKAQSTGFGLLSAWPLPPWFAVGAVVLALDLTFYVSHVAMHHVPAFWRFHSVHHADPAVDVTTTIRQHPGEGVIRYAFLIIAATALGASPQAFAVYRLWSVVNALFEHANIRVPHKLDALLATIITTPNMHKVHHSRAPEQSNTNYGNIFSIFDRAFETFTPTHYGLDIAYGLNDVAHEREQTTTVLLLQPFSRRDPLKRSLQEIPSREHMKQT
jgi:sterol desaturase/sphingolipid hydroxylase (fatty acid hydroxylase superfamily)